MRRAYHFGGSDGTLYTRDEILRFLLCLYVCIVILVEHGLLEAHVLVEIDIAIFEASLKTSANVYTIQLREETYFVDLCYSSKGSSPLAFAHFDWTLYYSSRRRSFIDRLDVRVKILLIHLPKDILLSIYAYQRNSSRLGD
jgi:hypothetical protein